MYFLFTYAMKSLAEETYILFLEADMCVFPSSFITCCHVTLYVFIYSTSFAPVKNYFQDFFFFHGIKSHFVHHFIKKKNNKNKKKRKGHDVTARQIETTLERLTGVLA